ncbi:Retrovirus-related Pol polyprotein from transposon RE2 [Vitis vinifera]|uniref:Retrovirus-related Pol polyprotein from transposon RE2 n=1 Tax=Vitis vinifera TaxID=29760 RepID=A0A438K024_VITVI|nr:Retrovirus-related Pol polyprotein from transposon RE2 [Vitis vinifera]
MKKMCDELKSENQVFKNELSLKKEESHPNPKRLSDLINSGRKSFDKKGLGFVDETTTPSSGKTIFVKPCEGVVPKKIPPKLKLHCTHCTKMGHTVDRCYVMMFESFQRKLTNLMNESFTLRNRLLQGGKRMFKRDSDVPHHSGFQGSTSNGMTKVTNIKQIWVKKNELNYLVVHTALIATKSHSWYFDSGCSRHMTGNRSFFTNFTEFDGGNVIFGDGNVASVKGKDTICAPGILNLEEVLLGHLNYRDLMKVANNEVIKEIPKLGKPSNPIYELLHMNLMGPMRTKSLGGKKYILVMVDDYSSLKPSTPLVILPIELTCIPILGRLVMSCGKFESKSEEGIFLGYSSKSRANRVYILSSKCLVESINVVVDDQGSRSRECDDNRIDVSKNIEVIEEKFEDEKLMLRPKDVNVIETKWIFKNKMDENGVIVKNKARILNEEVYVEQLKGFQDPRYPNHVYRLRKAPYGLKQTLKAWHERLTSYLLKKGFMRGGVDRTLFIRRNDEVFLVAQIYVDDIVFGFTSNECALDFAKEMKTESEMSMVGELTYFLGFQVKQLKDGIFLSQSKYARELVKKFGLESTKYFKTPTPINLKLSKDESGNGVKETLYKSMIGSLLYLTTSRSDIAFSVGVCARYQACPKESHFIALKRIISKKQNFVSLSTVEAKYIAAGSCCSQLLWIKQMLRDYGIDQRTMVVFCDNTSAINISKNPVLHSRTKHNDIRHHFIRDLVENKVLSLEYVPIEGQIVDILTKPLDVSRFESLRKSIGLCTIN